MSILTLKFLKISTEVLRGGYRNDRVAIMDGFGICGLSPPTKEVAFAGWADLEPSGPAEIRLPKSNPFALDFQ